MKVNKNKNCGYIKNFWFLSYVSFLLFYILLGANCSQNMSPDGEQLVQGKPVTKEVINKDVHVYTVKLERGQFLTLFVEQYDVDLITEVYTPKGDLLGQFDTPTSGRGTEQIRIGAETSGNYNIEIYTLSERAEPSKYKVEIDSIRPTTERDHQILSAIKFHQEADKLRAKPETIRESLPFYEKALQIWRGLGELPDEANTLRAMGFAYQRIEELENARNHFGQALEIWEKIGDWRSAAFTHIIFGVISKKQNDYENGLQEDLKAQPFWEKADDIPEYTQNLVRIGNDYLKLQKRAEAVTYFEQALEQSRRLERKSIQAYVLSECGNAQATFGNKNEALNFYRQSLELWKSLNQDKVVAGLEEKIAKLQVN